MLFNQIKLDVTKSLKSRDKVRTETMRFLLAALIKYAIDTYPVEKQNVLSDEEVIRIVRKQIKERRESILAFELGGRKDLAEKETQELQILLTFIPEELSDDEIRTIIQTVVNSGATAVGPVMGRVMREIKGRASGDRVENLVRSVLSRPS